MRLSIALCLMASTVGFAQSPARGNSAASPAETQAVRRAALDYIEGFYEGDTAKLVRALRPDMFKYGFWKPKDSTRYAGERMSYEEAIAYARRVKANNRPAPSTAPKEVTVYEVQDQTASAKVRAFWGTDYLLLGKYDGKWMISHVLWQSR